MKIDGLIPFNGETIQTKKLKELGYNANDINSLLKDELLVRTRRGFYKVTLKYDIDVNLMKYYLLNNEYDEFIDYFNSLEFKDYKAYYYRFMHDIMINDYANAYIHLNKCCELNKHKENKVNLYLYILLLHELMNLSNDKLLNIKNKLFTEEDSLYLFLECILNKDYDNAFKNLRISKQNNYLSNLDVMILRELSIKAGENYKRKNSPEVKMYDSLFNSFYNNIIDNDYDYAYFNFRKLNDLGNKLGLTDSRLDVIDDLFNCYNYIVRTQSINLHTYRTNYKYSGDNTENFYLAIKRNDYLKALEFTKLITMNSDDKYFIIYKLLLERIYNFLNIRTIIYSNSSNNKASLQGLIKDKKYSEALEIVQNENCMNSHDKNMVSSLLESIVALDDNTIFNSEN